MLTKPFCLSSPAANRKMNSNSKQQNPEIDLECQNQMSYNSDFLKCEVRILSHYDFIRTLTYLNCTIADYYIPKRVNMSFYFSKEGETQLCTPGQVSSDKADSLGVRFEFMKEGQHH